MLPNGRFYAIAGLGGLLLSLAGCGPITATTTIAQATVAIEAAEGAQAKTFAVYEYTSATEYLRKAREEEGFSDFQQAIDYAKQAREFAEQAKVAAMNSEARGLPPAQPGPKAVMPKAATPKPVTPVPVVPARPTLPSGSSL